VLERTAARRGNARNGKEIFAREYGCNGPSEAAPEHGSGGPGDCSESDLLEAVSVPGILLEIAVSAKCARDVRVFEATIEMSTRRAGFLYGSGAKMTPRTTLNTAVLAPMPKASVRTTIAAKLGDLRRIRHA
jgi:hypothetical protein